MPVSLKQELQMIKQVLKDDSIKLSTPLAHIVPRHHNFVTACDACKFGGGGWSTDLAYIWDLQFPQDIVDRAHLKNNKRGKLVSINSLEFLCVIVNMAAAICALAQGIPCNDPYPVLLNLCDNVSACAWVNFRCKESLIGRRLALVFVGLLMKSNLGIQAESQQLSMLSLMTFLVSKNTHQIHPLITLLYVKSILCNWGYAGSLCRQRHSSRCFTG